MRERKLVTDFGAYSTPKEFLVVCVASPGERLRDYLVPSPSSSFTITPQTTSNLW
jgi:hypothetical protein